ncbi:Tetratricopeptide repeat protein [Ooceraea biroi]|uniref:Tetratricopeptide repeat protein 29 n=1 Tax=Ooceraea biroi TaxID=2015173 RepID=A0A026WVX7_OOCBI|nr:Tetratricopeptide repeat protein [Ooceraea biroi]
MRKFDLKARVRAVQKDQPQNEKLSKIDFKIRGSERDLAGSKAIKTLAGARWHEMGKVKEELKAMLPTLKPSEVKRFHLPPHEAIIDELEEDGYKESAQYLRELFELDEETRKEAGPGTLIWKKPRLKENKDAMMRLKEGLMAFERAKDAGNLTSMATVFLDIALFFQAMTWEWWWLAERLYRSALVNAKLIRNDDQRMITLIRYLLGRFLFEQMQDTAESLVHLSVAREASQEKSWNASRITGRKEESLFRECNVLLYKILLVHAQQSDPGQPDVALKACTEALARAVDSGHREYMANALHELGKSQLRSGDVKSTLKSFSKLLAITKRIPDPEGICKAHLALASAYKLREVNDEVNTEKHLRLCREEATASKLPKELAQAHYCFGEYFLSKRRLDIATPHLETSFNLYNELDLHNDADKARTNAGVSKGQGVLDQYIDLVLRCGPADQKATLMLCQWKNRRSAFWTEKKLHTGKREKERETLKMNPDDLQSV